MNANELIEWAERKHWMYCKRASELVENLGKGGFVEPSFTLHAKKSRTAGWARYKKGVCDYSLVYILAVKEKYDRTIAHEVAHFVTRKLARRAKSHGDLFTFVFSELYCNGMSWQYRYHDYSYTENHLVLAKAILKMRKLKREMLKDAACSSEK